MAKKQKVSKLDALYAQFKAQEQTQAEAEVVETIIEPEIDTKKEQYKQLFNSFFVRDCQIIKAEAAYTTSMGSFMSAKDIDVTWIKGDGIFTDFHEDFTVNDFEDWYSYLLRNNFKYEYRIAKTKFYVIEVCRKYLQEPVESFYKEDWTLNGVEEYTLTFEIEETLDSSPPFVFQASFDSREDAEKWIKNNSYVKQNVVGREIPRTPYEPSRGWMGRDSYW